MKKILVILLVIISIIVMYEKLSKDNNSNSLNEDIGTEEQIKKDTYKKSIFKNNIHSIQAPINNNEQPINHQNKEMDSNQIPQTNEPVPNDDSEYQGDNYDQLYKQQGVEDNSSEVLQNDQSENNLESQRNHQPSFNPDATPNTPSYNPDSGSFNEPFDQSH